MCIHIKYSKYICGVSQTVTLVMSFAKNLGAFRTHNTRYALQNIYILLKHGIAVNVFIRKTCTSISLSEFDNISTKLYFKLIFI